ncbi:MAG: nicotinamide-nucleotide adenylyltransferase [Nanoarchaeota archaeon]|nr:nicotinamide-nucleotide adenylyltransferase [Nanoarchaeota archaeon]
MNCLFVGRFQPFHNGHLRDVHDALGFSEKVIIGVGSSEESGTPENPYSFEQRKEMIQRALHDDKIVRFEIVAIPDINDDGAWVSHVQTTVGKFDVVYTGNAHTRELFEKAGIAVRGVRFVKGVSGTITREMMAKGEEWKNLVPKSVAAYLENI